MSKALFICDSSEKNADLYYATGFRAPDPFIFFEVRGRKFMVMNDLEIDRARSEANVDEVLSINRYVELANKKFKSPGQAEVIGEILADQKIGRIVVPAGTSFALVDALRRQGYEIEAGPTPFFPERFVKRPDEKKKITECQRAVFAAIAMAEDVLRASRIKGRRLIFRGKALTSEVLRSKIEVFLLEKGFLASETIVSCGRHALDPHDQGRGPLLPNESIIVDVFPRSQKTYYMGDATRTFCRGRASENLKKLYATVWAAQKFAMSLIRPGVNGLKIHEAVHAFFRERGYETGEKGGRRQGFFHGTGHSIGLEVHEEPARITYRDYTLQEGNIMSVEPGLYYAGIGGVRVEDLVCIKKDGCEVLSGYPKRLEI